MYFAILTMILCLHVCCQLYSHHPRQYGCIRFFAISSKHRDVQKFSQISHGVKSTVDFKMLCWKAAIRKFRADMAQAYLRCLMEVSGGDAVILFKDASQVVHMQGIIIK